MLTMRWILTALMLAVLVSGCNDDQSGTAVQQSEARALVPAGHSSAIGPKAVTPGDLRGTGSVTLSWTAPTTNTNGSAITDLAGYQIVYGTSASGLSQTINVNGTGVTNYVVENLTPGTWYFAIESYNSSGVLSPESAVTSATVAVGTDSSAHR